MNRHCSPAATLEGLLVVKINSRSSARRHLGVFWLSVGLLVASRFGLAAPAYAAAAASTTTTLTVTSGGSAVTTVTTGTVVKLTATVTAGTGAVARGQVNFCDAAAAHCTDIHLLGTAQLTSAGTAVLNLKPGLGAKSFKAVFVGTTGAAATSSSAVKTLTVNGGVTTTAIAQSGSAGNYTLTATVVGVGSAIAPTGTVSFLDTSNANALLGSGLLGSGTLNLNFSQYAAYATGVPATAGVSATSAAAGDFNGDGILDQAVATNDGHIAILLGKGDGTFQSQSTYSVSTSVAPIVVGDFNGDGILDLAFDNFNDNTVGILLGKGDGTFKPQTSYVVGTQPESLAVGDFNGDGIQDLVTVNVDSSSVSVLLGRGDGTFQAQGVYKTGAYSRFVAIGDFNGDGIPDLVISDYYDDQVDVMLGKVDGTFQALVAYAVAGDAGPVAVADFNGDGIADIVVSGRAIDVLLGNGDGTFQAAVAYPVGIQPLDLVVGDFNADGIPDVAASSNAVNAVIILLGIGDGTFQQPVNFNTSEPTYGMSVADFNGDGIPDIATPNSYDPNLSVLLNQLTDTAKASASGISPVGATGTTHAVDASYPGDTVYAGSTSSTTSLTATPATAVSTKLTLAANPATGAFGQQVALTATLSPYSAQGQSSNGEMVTFYNGSTSLGTGTLNAGVATLNVTSLPVGIDSLSASYAGDTYLASSNANALSFTVTGANCVSNPATPYVNCNPGGSVVATNSRTEQLTFTPPAVTTATATAASTEIVGKYNGTIVYDQTFAAAYGTPTVQAGVAAADAAITSAGGSNATIPPPSQTSLSTKTSTASTSTYSVAQPQAATTIVTYSSMTTFGPAVVSEGGAPMSNPANPTGGQISLCTEASLPSSMLPTCMPTNPGTFTVLAGQTDVNINTDSNYQINTATTTTTTTTTVSSYAIAGVSATPTLSVSPTSLSFSTAQGTTSAAQIVMLTNTGTVAVAISSIAPTGSDASSFQQTNTCGSSLAVNASCTANLTFSPGAMRSFTAALSIVDNASGSPQVVMLTGTGTAAPLPPATMTAVTSSLNPSTFGASVMFTATVSSATAGAISGTATFFDNGLSIGTGTVTNGTGLFSTSTLSAGSHPITATFAPATGSAFATSNSTALTQVVNSPVSAQNFNFILTGLPSQTVIPGQSVSYNFALAPSAASAIYPGTVTFTIAGCPAHATCSITPTPVAATAGPQTEVLVVQTALPLRADAHPSLVGRRGIPIAFAFLLMPLILRCRLRSRTLSRLCLLVLASCAVGGVLIGCGSGNGIFAEAPSTSVITVTAMSGTYSNSAQVTVTIQ